MQYGKVRSLRLGRSVVAVALAAGALEGLGGCEIDSFINPSVLGYWEHTPTVVPILTRLGPI